MSTTEAGRLTASGKLDGSQGGVSLQAVIESARRLDELSCARVVGHVADAVHAAQKGGQPLATVTPAAIIVLPDGAVKLVPGAAAPQYMAPERLRGGSGDRRSDVFALGVVLWEALVHERLFDGASEDAIKRAILERTIRPPSELNANVPAELDAICKKALARDPADRYQSAKVMAAEIDAVLGDAGYPDGNEQIARYVTRALAAEPAAAPRPPVLPPIQPAPASKVAPQTTPPTTLPGPAAPAAAHPASPPPPVAPPPAAASAPAAAVVPAAAPSGRRSPASTTLTGAAPPSAASNPPARPTPASGVANPTSGTLPSLVSGQRPTAPRVSPAAPAAEAVRSAAAGQADQDSAPAPVAAPAATVEPAPRAPAKSAKTEILGSLPPGSLAAPPEKPPEKPPAKPQATTAFLGSNAIAGDQLALAPSSAPRAPAPGAPTMLGAAAMPGPAPATTTAPFGAAPAPAPATTAAPAPAALSPPSAPPSRPPTHPQPPARTSIASAETIATPQLAAQPGIASPVLGMPPGMTVAPATPPAPLQSTDHRPQDHDPDPGDVVMLPQADRATGGRDVLAGWGWSTGSVEVIEDDDFHDTARASRKRLVIAIGGALGVVIVIAIAAFAFSGSPPTSDPSKGAGAALPSATARAPAAPPVPTTPPTSPPGPAAETAPTAPEPANPSVAPATPQPPPAPPAPGESSAAPPAPATPPGAAPSTAASAAAEPARGEPTTVAPPAEPAKVAATPPAAPEPPKVAATPPAPAEPPKVASTRPPATEPPGKITAIQPPTWEPPKTAAKPAVAIKAAEPPKPAPVKPEAAKPEPAKKLDSRKPPEPKKPPEHALKRPAPPEKLAPTRPLVRAQPLDPYAAPAVDPATAYKTGLQQYARGDTGGALATFRGSLSSSPGFAPTWRGLGLVYEKMGNKGQARAAFKHYLQLAPDAGDADQIRDRLERLGP